MCKCEPVIEVVTAPSGYTDLSEIKRTKKKPCHNFDCECQGAGHEESN